MLMNAFTYERVKEHTGRVQYRTNGSAVASVANRKVRAGEVVEFANEDFTRGLVQTGNFIHVAADTPLGVPHVIVEEEQPTDGVGQPETVFISGTFPANVSEE